MRLECQSCSSALTLADIDTTTGLARCSHCASVYDLGGWRTGGLSEDLRGPRVRPRVAMPPKIQVETTSGGFEVSWRWLKFQVFFLIPFCIAWDSFLFFWYAQALGGAGDEAGWIMVVFPIAHVAVGVGLTWYTLALLVNRTRLSVMRGFLRVKIGPLPWRGNLRVPSSALAQLFVKEKVHHHSNGVSRTYHVWAILRDGTQKKLVSGLDELDQALWLEQEIENWLGIRDQPVPGEAKR